MRTWLSSWKERYKRLVLMSTDIVLIWLALWLALCLHRGSLGLISVITESAWLFLAAPLIAIPIFYLLGMYRVVLRYTDGEALIMIGRAVLVSVLFFALFIYWHVDQPGAMLRSMLVNYLLLSLLFAGGLRVLLRYFFNGNLRALFNVFAQDTHTERVAIYGAGNAGHQLVASLRLDKTTKPVAFIDDNRALYNRVAAGLKV